MGWLATTASVSPFIGLLGTVLGIIRSFEQLGSQRSSSATAVSDTIKDLHIVPVSGGRAIPPNGKAANINQLGPILKSCYRGQAAYLKGDRAATWDLVTHVMSALGGG